MTAKLCIIDKKTAELAINNEAVDLEIPGPQQGKKLPILKAPNIKLKLEWIYGYRGRNAHKTMVYVRQTHELVYYSATIAILYHMQKTKQRFYRGHNGNIRCITLHPEGVIIATGQEMGLGKKTGPAVIHIWRADTLQTLRVIGRTHSFCEAVVQLAFSISDKGEKLSAVSLGDFHVLTVWNWDSEILVADPYEFKNPIFDVEFNPLPTIPTELVSFGRGQLFSWLIRSNATLKPTLIDSKVINKSKLKDTYFTCFAFSPNADILVGDSDGYLHTYLKEDRSVSVRVNTGSDAPLFCMHFLTTGCLVTGSCDGLVALWDTTYHRRLKSFLIDHAYGVARVIVDLPNGDIFVGTNKNCIVSTDTESEFKPFLWGHGDEVPGLCSGPNNNFVTCGKDKRVIMWDSKSCKTIWASEVRYEARCAAVSASNRFVAVGCYTGHWVLMNALAGHRFNEGRTCYDTIECISFSPVDTFLAMGAKSGEIYIFIVTEKDLAPRGLLKMPTGPTTHLDFSIDSCHLRTCSNDRKIHYWAIPQCKEDDSDYVKYDHYWWTKTCTTAYLNAGIWKDAKDLSDVNDSAVNVNETLIASADDYGKVNVLRYICNSLKCEKVSEAGHGTTVKDVDFMKASPKLLSVGGRDYSVLQWKIVVTFD